MAKRKKKRTTGAAPRPGPADRETFRSRPFAEALEALEAARKEGEPAGAERTEGEPPRTAPAPAPPAARRGRTAAPQTPLSEEDRDALGMAMVGVVPLSGGGPRRVTRSAEPAVSRTAGAASEAGSAEDRARSRLDALVADGVTFQVERNEEYVRGARTGLDPGVLRRLGKRMGAHDTLDLHGLSQAEARRELSRFVRGAHRRGLELLCVVHGKGLHSEGGLGVLRELAVDTLTGSGCAPCVRAFCTAPAKLGGTGALLVELQRR